MNTNENVTRTRTVHLIIGNAVACGATIGAVAASGHSVSTHLGEQDCASCSAVAQR